MFDLKSILGGQVRKKGVAKSMEASVVCDKFDAWAVKKFGEVMGRKVRAVKFENGILTLSSQSSVLSQEIKLNEPQIKQEVNGILGDEVIKLLMFRS
jgi:hypothetical protein